MMSLTLLDRFPLWRKLCACMRACVCMRVRACVCVWLYVKTS